MGEQVAVAAQVRQVRTLKQPLAAKAVTVLPRLSPDRRSPAAAEAAAAPITAQRHAPAVQVVPVVVAKAAEPMVLQPQPPSTPEAAAEALDKTIRVAHLPAAPAVLV
jgi:hypothetical protein